MKRFVKDRDAKKDYQIPWAQFLGVDTIVASTFTPDANLWTALTAYYVGDRVRLAGGAFLEVTVAGTSGAVAPTPPAVSATVVDGTVTWLRSFNVETSAFTDTVTTLWVSGGTVGKEYFTVNHITTLGGRIEDEMVGFLIIEK